MHSNVEEIHRTHIPGALYKRLDNTYGE